MILGGTSVHDFFIYAELVDTIHITIEPHIFNEGVRAFSYINFKDYKPYFLSRNYSYEEKTLNENGSIFVENKICVKPLQGDEHMKEGNKDKRIV